MCVFFCCTKARDLQRLYYQAGCAEELSWHLSFAEADLGKAPLFGVKKEEITEGRKAGRASKAKPSKKRSRERKEKGNCRYKCYESYRSRVGPSTPFYPDVFSVLDISTSCEMCQHSTNFMEQKVKKTHTHSVLASTPSLKGVCKRNVCFYQKSSTVLICHRVLRYLE